MTEENQDVDHTSDDSLPSDADVGSEDGQQEADADGDSKDVENLSLSELNELTGKKFPNKDAALKSISDTFSHVGKSKEQAKKEAEEEMKSGEDYVSQEELNTKLFFLQNPNHDRELAEALAVKNGISPQEATETEKYKEIHSALESKNESEQKDTVLESNTRRSASSGKNKEAFEKAKKSGKTEDWAEVLRERE